MAELMSIEDIQVLETVRAFLHREARLLDDRDFDAWIACYHPDAEYSMPSWDDDHELTTDPQTEISLIYYADRGGLEDRVFRIKTDRSSATSLPEPRHSHNPSDIEVLGRDGDTVHVRCNWLTGYFRYNNDMYYWGCAEVDIDLSGDEPQITKKKVVLKNDYIHQVIDVYMI
ncbi:Benzoate 1,2-dioxygenase beta subunit [Kocuria palustris PEL]|uniref:Benzoate 1,2-dioxygenase beta subunit n=1 Tax=Kocuria palustris PEL TaxID=1236550 RepID=M2XE43_9MICC|nr:benzoate 1,2-dioxygenase small subunit [Kocuria palustris]EME37376.1 Benzoate 1,2-dioxygenase beta subunit [Kocuria palustris PEL]